MGNFNDLPNELLERVIALLRVVQTGPRGFEGYLRDAARLCRVSKRLCSLVKPELYTVAAFDDGFDMSLFFCVSGIRSLPTGSLRSIFISPKETAPTFFLLEQSIDLFAQYCSAVRYLEIYLHASEFFEGRPSRLVNNTADIDPMLYLPIIQSVNPRALICRAALSPYGTRLFSEAGEPSLPLSSLLWALSKYTCLSCLRMPMVDFDDLGVSGLQALARLPIEYVRFDWPTSLTCAKVLALLGALPRLQDNGLVLYSRYGFAEGHGQTADGHFLWQPDMPDDAEEEFAEKNPGLNSATLAAFLADNGRNDLLAKVQWHALPQGLGQRDARWQKHDHDVWKQLRDEKLESWKASVCGISQREYENRLVT